MNDISKKIFLAAGTSKCDANRAAPALNIKQLLGGFREVRLFHGSEEYKLRLTKNDKLILTK